MAVLTDAEVQVLRRIVDAQAAIVARRYEGINAEDVGQEVWVAFLDGDAATVSKYLAAGHEGKIAKVAYSAAIRYCEKERKSTLGYDWRDDYTYSRPEVARLLPLALDPTAIPGLSGSALHDGPSVRSDPAYGGGMLASIVDVRVAYEKLSDEDQQFLMLCVGFDQAWEYVGLHTGLQPNSAYAKYMRILDRMITRHLGRKVDTDAA
jgi:hypothetical protein